ncbi:MAG: winged helix DNA-binding protein [Nitrospiraceae bacterium]|nr:winged helix DNA-binding protein [Nitrospiraceae bacterium]
MKRTKLDITYDILSAMLEKRGRIKPTHLLYKANLSYSMMKKYLDELIKKEYVKETKTKEKYTYLILTDKGRDFFHELNKMKDFKDAFGL